MKKNIFKIFALLMVLAMVVAPVSATPTAKTSVPETSDLSDVSQPSLQFSYPEGYKEAIKDLDGTARFIILLEDDPLVSYDGSIPGLKATDPKLTGEEKLDIKSPDNKAYLSYLVEKQTNTIKNIESVLGKSVDVDFQYKIGLNGLAVELSAKELKSVVENVSGIIHIEREKIYHLDTDAGPAFIGAPALWENPGVENQGEGIVVGIIDSGINFDHPSFAEVGPVDGYVHENPLGDGVFLGVCDPTNDEQYDDTYICNNKLIGAYSYVDTDEYELYTPEDSGGHGSHTASTVAGNVVEATMEKPTLNETQTISGVAPHANIIAYDVCYEDSTDGGCGGAAIYYAIEQSMVDAVDVINFSISGGEDAYNDFTEMEFFWANYYGIFVSTSAGNNGPGPETTGHRSPWLMSTAASTHNRTYINGLVDMTGGDTAAPADIEGKGFTSGVGPLPIVYAGDYGNALCLGSEDSGAFNTGTDFTGQIVVCDRGISARVRKAEVVADLGAAGYVLANNEASGDALVGDAYVIPGVHISYDDGVILKTWLASGTGHTATVLGATRDMSASNGNIMADFSSRGPNGTIDVLKPDVTAPGVDIWAAVNSPVPGEGNPEYDFYSGTSMSSPHTAGAAALLKKAHPGWSNMEIKSALMLTAVNPGIKKEDGTTDGDPFDFGAGLIQVDLAAEAGLIMHESSFNFFNADPGLGGNPQTLNLASVYNSTCFLECSWTRTVENALDVDTAWTISTVEESTLGLTVSPMTFTLAPGETQELTITANVETAEAGTWLFGDIQMVEDGELAPDSHIPLAVNPSPALLPEDVLITTRRNAGSELIEGVQAIEALDLTAQTFGWAEANVEQFFLLEDPTTSSYSDDFDQVHITEVSVPEGALRFVSEVLDTTSPDLDMFLLVDEGDGAYLYSYSATATAYERIEFLNPPAGDYYVIIQNYEASAVDFADGVVLSTGVVTDEETGNMMVEIPNSVAQGEYFDIRVFWDTPEMTSGDVWYGLFTLGTDDAHPDNLGVVPATINRYMDDVTKNTDMLIAWQDDIVSYTITIQPNITGKDLIYLIEDTIPAGMELVPDSLTEGVITSGNKIVWVGIMPGGMVADVNSTTNAATCDTERAYEILASSLDKSWNLSGVSVVDDNPSLAKAFISLDSTNDVVCVDYAPDLGSKVITYQLKVITDEMMVAPSTLRHTVFQPGAKDVFIHMYQYLNSIVQMLPIIFK